VSDDHEQEHESRWAQKLADRREAYQQRGTVYKVVYLSAGVTVTLIGIAMLALPGPALVVIPIGLAMLAVQFAWAENALEKALVQAEKAQTTAKEASRTQKILGIVAVALGIAAFITAALLWDIPLIPDP
jgi:uncharacterized protein (TIGR02611 family)